MSQESYSGMKHSSKKAISRYDYCFNYVQKAIHDLSHAEVKSRHQRAEDVLESLCLMALHNCAQPTYEVHL